jgi:hypothetical protein
MSDTEMTAEERTDYAAKAAIIEAQVARAVEKLSDWARHMAGRFNGAVYLVGSFLHHPDPRDCDIRIVIPDHEFAIRYGMAMERVEFNEFHPLRKRRGILSGECVRWSEDGPTQRWIDDTAKLGAGLLKAMQHNMDVKVWPDSHWREPYPTPITLAAPSPRYFIYTRHCPDPGRPC